MQENTFLRFVLRADGAFNVVGGVVLLVAVSFWASAFGLANPWPIIALAVVFLVNGAECWLNARRRVVSVPWLLTLAAVDLVFAAFALAVAVTDPTGAETWARWTLAVLGGAAAVIGIIKAAGANRLRGGATTPVTTPP